MTGMNRLLNTIRPYAWGSTTAIPELLGTEPSGEPQAELWMGAHPGAPSRLDRGDGPVPLDAVIDADPAAELGEATVKRFGPRLPFLKVLAGDEEASAGTVTIAKRARVGVLRQDRFLDDEQIILDLAMRGDAVVWNALAEQRRLLEPGGDAHVDAGRMADLEDLIAAHDGYTLEARASEVLEGLAIPTRLHRSPLSALETELSPRGFLRTHRSWLVNAAQMTALKPEGSGDYTVELGPVAAPLSRRFPEALAKLRGE